MPRSRFRALARTFASYSRYCWHLGANRICASASAEVYKTIIVSYLPRLGRAPSAAVDKRLILDATSGFGGLPDLADYPPRQERPQRATSIQYTQSGRAPRYQSKGHSISSTCYLNATTRIGCKMSRWLSTHRSKNSNGLLTTRVPEVRVGSPNGR